MKKKCLTGFPEKRSLKKLGRIMRVTVFLIIGIWMTVSAESYSQGTRMDIRFKNQTIRDVIEYVEKSSDFVFLYKDLDLNVDKRVDIDLKKATINQILDAVFEGENVVYDIYERQILLRKSGSNPVVQQPEKKPVSGMVVGKDGQPLPGVTVLLKGTTVGTVTDGNGKFTLQVPVNAQSLVFSFVGMKSQEIAIAGKSTLSVVMEEESIGIAEVVAVGYGVQDARKVSGSISSVSSRDFDKINVPNFEVALQGRSSGMMVSATSGEPGALARIRIRGSNSIQGKNEPLIVLDGYPLFTDYAPTGGLDASNTSNLSFINMDDVASVEVLKDAAATAIYGARGANGVLLITTKKGKAAEKPTISFSAESFISESPKFPAMMSGPQYAEFWNANLRTPAISNTDTITTIWIDKILQKSWGQKYNLSVSGGSSQNRYLVSGSYSDYSGVIIGSGLQRATLRANLNNKLSEKLSVSTILNYSVTGNNRAGGSDGTSYKETGGGVIFNALRASPLVPGDQLFTIEAEPTPNNPVFQLTDQKDNEDIRSLIANLNLDYQVFKDLKITIQGGTTSTFQNRERYWGKKTSPGYLYNSRSWVLNQLSYNYLIESYATYSKSFNRHSINAVVGYSWQKNVMKSNVTMVSNIMTDALGVYGLEFGTNVNPYYYRRVDRELQSYFFRANYDFGSKYLLSFSGRMDGSSVFTENNKYGFFPSISAAWRVNEEEFMKSIRAISEFKLRAGYGETGSQAIEPYQSIPQYGKANYVYGNSEKPGVRPVIMGNPDLKWETTEQLNAGLDLKLLKGRIGFIFDYYEKTTRDLLMPFQLPGSAGYSTITVNKGKLGNKGIEITIEGEPVSTADFSWRTNLNYSRNRSKVLDLGGLPYIPGPIMDNNFLKENITGQFVGQPMSLFYGYKLTGLIQPADFDAAGKPTFPMYNNIQTLGTWKFKDQNGDGVITAADRVFLGDPNPDFVFGFNNDFTYKNFTLNVFIQGVYGNDLFNASDVYVGTGYSIYNNYARCYENRWTLQNQHNDINYPAGMNFNVYLRPTNAVVEDGSYARLKNVSLRYNIPLKKQKLIRSLEVYLTGTNLATITKYSGLDPEVSLFGNRDDAVGVDFFAYPQCRTYTFGIKMGL